MSVVELHESETARGAAPRGIRAVLLGYGRVGRAVAEQVESRREDLRAAGVDLRLCRALVRDVTKTRPGALVPLTASTSDVLDDADVVIEAMGGIEPARRLLTSALDRRVAVVTANKSLVASHGAALHARAAASGTPWRFEAAVVAGVPFVGAIARRPLFARARRLEGILNGTSHFILTEMVRGSTFGAALATAVARGCAEPDATADVDGRDAAEKLTILLHLCGWTSAAWSEVPRSALGAVDAQDFRGADALGGTIKPIACADLDGASAGAAWAGPAFVTATHEFARLDGVSNALTITGWTGDRVTFSGPGAGPAVTAATLLDDVVEVVTERPLCGRVRPRLTLPPLRQPSGAWFLRLERPRYWTECDVNQHLAARGVFVQQARTLAPRVYAHVVASTSSDLIDALRALAETGVRVLALPIIGSSSED